MDSKLYIEIKNICYKLDNGICHICNKTVSFKDASLDHIIPQTINGELNPIDEYWNIRIAHRGCNSKRSNGRIPGQVRLSLEKPSIEKYQPIDEKKSILLRMTEDEKKRIEEAAERDMRSVNQWCVLTLLKEAGTKCQWCGSPVLVEKSDNYTAIKCTNPECKAVGRLS